MSFLPLQKLVRRQRGLKYIMAGGSILLDSLQLDKRRGRKVIEVLLLSVLHGILVVMPVLCAVTFLKALNN